MAYFVSDHQTASGAINGAMISTTGLFLGAQIDALLIGLISAFFVSVWLDTIDDKLKSTCAVLFASLLAGYGSPFAANLMVNEFHGIGNNADGLRLLMALLIGACAPTVVPLALKYLARKGEQL